MGYSKRAIQREAEERAKLAARPHEIRMQYQRLPNGGWVVRFTPSGSDWVIRVCRFADPDKIRSLFRRFATRRLSEDVQAFEFGLRSGTGALELRLGDEQLAALKQQKVRR